jgi:hypothetical protein
MDMNIKNFIKKLQESESYRKFKDEMHETSTTGMVAGYDTPKAFAPQDGEGKEKFDAQTKDNAEQFGYKIVKKASKRNTVSESSTTSGVGIVTVGESFVNYGFEEDDDLRFEDDNEQKPHHTMIKTVKSAGYTPVKRGLKEDSTYKQAMKVLHEASYKEYKGDKTRTTSEKINNSIKELNQSLLKVERAVGHALRLKTEMSVDQRSLWRSSHNRLVKIGERLNRIGKKINELGA